MRRRATPPVSLQKEERWTETHVWGEGRVAEADRASCKSKTSQGGGRPRGAGEAGRTLLEPSEGARPWGAVI